MTRYKVVLAESGKQDVRNKKKYILQHFKYREYAESYANRIRNAAKELVSFPAGYTATGFCYRNYNIFLKPSKNDLLFFTVNDATHTVTVLRVLQDGMDWETILSRWIARNS